MRSPRKAIRWVALLGAVVVGANLVAAQMSSPARLLVLLRDAGAVAIVDPVAGKVLGRVPTLKGPHEVTASPDGKLAFVANQGTSIAVIDLVAQKELRQVEIGPGSQPHDVRFAGGKVYFTAEGWKTVGRYDPATNKVDWLLGLGQDSIHMLVLTKDLNTMYTANRVSSSVGVIEGVSAGPPKWRVSAIPVNGKTPEGIDLSPDGREVWTATRGDGNVHVIDVAARKVTHTLNLKMKDANRLKFTPDGTKVLISDGGGNSLVVLDAVARKEIKRLSMAPDAVLVHPDGSRAYAALRGDHRVAVIDLKTLEVIGNIPTGPESGPGCMYWIEGR